MGKVSFIFSLHNHQPVGNFGHIFQESFDNCYKPFIDVLGKHPSIKVVLHYSGPLFDWMEEHAPSYLNTIRKLVKRGQVELLSGGYYEPLLPLIPEADAFGQIKKMNTYIKKRFSFTPQGFWLTERVWEPTFPSIAHKSGLTFTALDDSHFLYAGLSSKDIRDFYITENDGHILNIFPISKYLRYAIPFKPHQEIISYFRSFSNAYEQTIVTLADDGEKFGVWPGTHQWVYKEKWLEKFFSSLEDNTDWLETITFSEGLQKKRAKGRIYIPTASYEEMMEWVLPPDQTNKLESVKKTLSDAGLFEEAKDFIRGGYFRNFFTKYSEANAMKGKQFYVSAKVHALKNSTSKKEALNEVWKGECNCPYWHGVFGGLYLHHLRRSTYDHLIKAECIADEVLRGSDEGGKIIQQDINFDGIDEILFESKTMNVYVIPHEGGAICEIDYRPRSFNITDTMTKRPEAYHTHIRSGNDSSGSGTDGASIHDLKKTVSQEIRDNLIYDRHIRRSLIDKCIPDDVSFNDFKRNEYEDMATFYSNEYATSIDKRKKTIALIGEGYIQTKKGRTIITIQKEITFGSTNIQVAYVVTNKGRSAIQFCFGSEWNFNFKNSDKQFQSVKKVTVHDEWSNMGVIFSSAEAFTLWQYPIQTVSQTESEYCLSDQGTSLFPHWHMTIPPEGQRTVSFHVDIIEQ
ncbi:MAG: DUF1926 domain-containing protein [Candidatus Omnitrophica bacterium]|nr:DUF1926 domain-containing protein [Candidatus Omnitrophota bacterium]